MIQRIEQRASKSASRRIFGVFVLCWLNLAITPCAVAFELADDCPHCPPAAEQEMAHHGHDAANEADCGSMQSDCCDLEAAAFDNRGAKVENQDDVSVAAIPVTWPSLHKLSATQHDTRPPDPGNYSPPLHKLFCVYLD